MQRLPRRNDIVVLSQKVANTGCSHKSIGVGEKTVPDMAPVVHIARRIVSLRPFLSLVASCVRVGSESTMKSNVQLAKSGRNAFALAPAEPLARPQVSTLTIFGHDSLVCPRSYGCGPSSLSIVRLNGKPLASALCRFTAELHLYSHYWETPKYGRDLFSLCVLPGKGTLAERKATHRAISSVFTQMRPVGIGSPACPRAINKPRHRPMSMHQRNASRATRSPRVPGLGLRETRNLDKQTSIRRH